MKARLLLLVLLATAALDAQAQQAPAPTPTPAVATHADTVEVIHQVFRRARRFGRLGTIAEGVGIAPQVLLLAVEGNKLTPASKVIAVTTSLSYSFFLFKFMGDWKHFSKRREEQAVRRFELHQPQPLYVQRRLMAHLVAAHK